MENDYSLFLDGIAILEIKHRGRMAHKLSHYFNYDQNAKIPLTFKNNLDLDIRKDIAVMVITLF